MTGGRWVVPAALLLIGLFAAKREGAGRAATAATPSAGSRRRTRDDRSIDPAADPATASGGGRGRNAARPQDIPLLGWKDILWRSYERFGRDRILAVSAGMTFYALLAIFPAIATLVSLYGLFADASTIQSHLDSLAGILPGGAIDIVGDQLKRISSQGHKALGFGFVTGLVLSLWSANAGMKALFDALNVAYEEDEKRGFFALNLRSLAFTLAALVFAMLALGLIVVLPAVFDFFGLKSVTDDLLALLRWPALLAGVIVAFDAVYRWGPSREAAQWRWVTWGSGVAAVGWLIVSALFSWYAAHFGTYNQTYGSLGAAIGFMTWIWISATVVLVGGELNAEMEHQTARDTTAASGRPLGARGATMADSVGAVKA